MPFGWFWQIFVVLRLKIDNLASFLARKKRCFPRWLKISVTKNLKTPISLSLKVKAVCGFFPCVSMYLMHIRTCGFHAQEAGGHHQEGGEPHQVLARGAIHPMGPFQTQNCFNKELVYPKYTYGLIYVVHTVGGVYKGSSVSCSALQY